MRHEMLSQRAFFCHRTNTKRGTLSQHFVTHVVPPLGDRGSLGVFFTPHSTASEFSIQYDAEVLLHPSGECAHVIKNVM